MDILANENTPFHHAIIQNKLEITQLFLGYGVNVEQSITDSSGFSYSPLQYSCQSGLKDMIKLLLRNGVQDKDNVARIEAVQSGKEDLVQLFLNNGWYLQFRLILGVIMEYLNSLRNAQTCFKGNLELHN